MTSPTPTQPGRTASGRSMLARYGSPVRLPIDDAVRPSAPPPAPRPRPTIRPAALGPRVDNGHTNLTTIPGMLANEVRIPRPKIARLEAAAEPVYQILGHEARVLLRVLDHASASVPDRNNFWAVPWATVVEAFAMADREAWESIAAAHKAIDELSELQVACIIPGHRLGHEGTDDPAVPVLYICEHALRQMLRSMVLNEPDAIPVGMPRFDIVIGAQRSFTDAPPRPARGGEVSAHADGEGINKPGAAARNNPAA